MDRQRIPIFQQQKEAVELERAGDETAVGEYQQEKLMRQFPTWAKQVIDFCKVLLALRACRLSEAVRVFTPTLSKKIFHHFCQRIS